VVVPLLASPCRDVCVLCSRTLPRRRLTRPATPRKSLRLARTKSPLTQRVPCFASFCARRICELYLALYGSVTVLLPFD
jgi:hypothetical protein